MVGNFNLILIDLTDLMNFKPVEINNFKESKELIPFQGFQFEKSLARYTNIEILQYGVS